MATARHGSRLHRLPIAVFDVPQGTGYIGMKHANPLFSKSWRKLT